MLRDTFVPASHPSVPASHPSDVATSETAAGRSVAPRAVLTANDLLSGRVVWWTGSDWSEAYGDAATAAAEDAGLTARAAAEEAANRVVGAIVVALDEAGAPKGLREGRRHAGPSIALPAAAAQGTGA